MKSALYEVEFDLEVNTYTGEYKILEVRDRKLKLVPKVEEIKLTPLIGDLHR